MKPPAPDAPGPTAAARLRRRLRRLLSGSRLPKSLRRALRPAAVPGLAAACGVLLLLLVLLPATRPAWVSGLLARAGLSAAGHGAERPPGSGRPDHGSASPAGSGNGRPGSLFSDWQPDPEAVPAGLGELQGEGGTGVNRAVKKNGVWIPVYSPGSRSGKGPPPLTVVPLTIASSNPLPGKVNVTLTHRFEAVGGAPPYQWTAVIGGPPGIFTLGREDGLLSGLSAEPVTAPLELAVTDSAGIKASAAMKLVILPDRELAIDTAEIPVLVPGGALPAFRFTASGGVPPWQWEGGPPVNGVTLHAGGPEAGALATPPLEAREDPWTVSVIDSQNTRVSKTFQLIAAGEISITTPAGLPPAVPGQPYEGRFEAEGGVPPYHWELTAGQLPDDSWRLETDGTLSGMAPAGEHPAEFSVRVMDSREEAFEKTFRLVTGDLLIVVPSFEKAGVAWRPDQAAALAARSGISPAGVRVRRDGLTVYEGTGSNFVDRGLRTGSTPLYSLSALTAGGGELPLSRKQTAILPMTTGRGGPGVNGDPYVDRVSAFRPLSPGGYGSGQMPANVTGPPDGRSVYAPASKASEVLSLHAARGAGGSIELEFTDNIVDLREGEDLTVFENVLFAGGDANQRFMEPAVISVALFPGEWVDLPCDVIPPADGTPLNLMNPFYYARGFAGRNGTTGGDPTNPSVSGGDSFDLNAAAAARGLTWIRYVRLRATGDQAMTDDAGGDPVRHNNDPAFNPLSGAGSSGFDLDAVSAVNF